MATEREKSPRRTMCAAVLTLEGLSVALVIPVMISISGVATGTAVGLGLGLAVVCFLAAGLLRRPWGYWLGWAAQIAAVAMGVIVPMMYVVGALFAILWAAADLLGRKIDGERAAAYAAFDRMEAERDASAS